jgi:transposase
MIAPSIRYVVGIAVAKRTHVCCVLEAATANVCVRTQTTPASAEGYGHLAQLLGQYGAPATVLVGLEATGCLWEPLYAALDQAGYPVLVLNPRQSAAWGAALGLRAKTDEIDALTLARGLLAGYGQASRLPSEAVQALRTLTRARHDLVQARAAAKQRLRDELVVLFPELPEHTPEGCDLFAPGLLRLLSVYPAAHAVARAEPAVLAATLAQVRYCQLEVVAG